MWLATKHGWFSVVCGRNVSKVDKAVMIIRARKREHLENLIAAFKGAELGEIKSDTGTDYPCRLVVGRRTGLLVLSALANEIDYSNFKDAAHDAHPEDVEYGAFLLSTWGRGIEMEGSAPNLNRDWQGLL